MLSAVVIAALAAVYTVRLLRLVPWVRARARTGTKPWSCNVCLSFWTAAPYAIVAALLSDLAPGAVLVVPAAAGLAYVALSCLDAIAPSVPAELP